MNHWLDDPFILVASASIMGGMSAVLAISLCVFAIRAGL